MQKVSSYLSDCHKRKNHFRFSEAVQTTPSRRLTTWTSLTTTSWRHRCHPLLHHHHSTLENFHTEIFRSVTSPFREIARLAWAAVNRSGEFVKKMFQLDFEFERWKWFSFTAWNLLLENGFALFCLIIKTVK